MVGGVIFSLAVKILFFFADGPNPTNGWRLFARLAQEHVLVSLIGLLPV